MNTSDRLDLSAIPMVDNHAHAMTRAQPEDPVALRAHFAEAHNASLARDHIQSSVQYRWALRQLGALLESPPTEDEILARRGELGLQRYARTLADAANLAWLLLDEGYPPPETGYSSAEMEAMLGVRVGRILRIETLVQGLVPLHDSIAGVREAFDAALESAWNDGFVGFKSIAAYRSGLAIERVEGPEVEQAFRVVRRRAGEHFRLTSKLLIDYFVYRALRYAAARSLPVQFHTGYGDPDLDLRAANPLHLRALFEDPEIAGVPIVMLHESYPFTAEAAFLAAVYPNAYLDLAFSLPPLARGELTRCARIAIDVAPVSKLMCSSDGVGIPEHYWLGAVRARACLADVFSDLAARGDLDRDETLELAELLLWRNAIRVYDLQGDRVRPLHPVT